MVVFHPGFGYVARHAGQLDTVACRPAGSPTPSILAGSEGKRGKGGTLRRRRAERKREGRAEGGTGAPVATEEREHRRRCHGNFKLASIRLICFHWARRRPTRV